MADDFYETLLRPNNVEDVSKIFIERFIEGALLLREFVIAELGKKLSCLVMLKH